MCPISLCSKAHFETPAEQCCLKWNGVVIFLLGFNCAPTKNSTKNLCRRVGYRKDNLLRTMHSRVRFWRRPRLRCTPRPQTGYKVICRRISYRRNTDNHLPEFLDNISTFTVYACKAQASFLLHHQEPAPIIHRSRTLSCRTILIQFN